MSIRMRHTKSHRNNRRQHLKLEHPALTRCPKCKAPVRGHTVCANCGTYRGRQVFDVLAKLTKRERKKKEKELENVSAEKLSRK